MLNCPKNKKEEEKKSVHGGVATGTHGFEISIARYTAMSGNTPFRYVMDYVDQP